MSLIDVPQKTDFNTLIIRLLTNMMQKQKFCVPWHCLTLHVSTVNLIR